MTQIALLPDPVVVKRHYRWRGDYDHVDDFLRAVERESCHNCGWQGPDTDTPMVGCPVLRGRIGDIYDKADAGGLAVPEWVEIVPGARIRCRAWTDRAPLPGQEALL